MTDLLRFGARPVHLFIFRRQSLTLRFASTGPGRDFEAGGHTYLGAQIERDAIKQTAERAKDKLKIRMAHLLDPAAPELPITQALGGWWRPHIPSDPIHVTCLATEHGATAPPRVEWSGWAIQPAYTDTELELTCDPNSPHGDAVNQGAKWQRACFKTVYSKGPRGCNLDEEDFKIEGVLEADAEGLTLAAPEFIGTEFTLLGGTFYWERPDGLREERPIMAHNNDTGQIQILWGGEGLVEGAQVVAVPNCPGTWAACAARRPDPELHYGGAIYKPVKDPILDGVSMSWG